MFDSTHFLNQKKYVRRGHYAATANAFTWKRILDEVGVFDETLRSGGDAEWGKRVHQHGYNVLYADGARVYHPARHSYRAVRRKKARVLEGTTRSKKERGYPLAELIIDVTKDIGHHAKFAVCTALEGRYGWKEIAALLIAFPIQGVYTAAKRAQMWSSNLD